MAKVVRRQRARRAREQRSRPGRRRQRARRAREPRARGRRDRQEGPLNAEVSRPWRRHVAHHAQLGRLQDLNLAYGSELTLDTDPGEPEAAQHAVQKTVDQPNLYLALLRRGS